MTHRERFQNIFAFRPVDRIPIYFFGSWGETKARWQQEGLEGILDLAADQGPQLPGMDPDWEAGLWSAHGTARLGPIGDVEPAVLSEKPGLRVIRNSIGKVEEIRTDGTSIAHTISYPLEPTRESWRSFRRYLERDAGPRYPADLDQVIARRNSQDIVTGFMGGSLYGWLRDYMGVENLSYLMFDDPELLSEMVGTVADHCMELMRPVLPRLRTDFVYFFEDCCGSSGPLFSPAIYREIFDPHYRRMISFYKQQGVPLALIDSDGWVEPLVPCWLESGFDILFPIEVGKWGANPADMRGKYGQNLRMLGGVDKRLIPDERALRAHLQSLEPEVRKGGFLPIPDHRIPPEVSYQQMQRYIQIFDEVMNG